jgi:protein tyrosine/serine phosphatase
MKKVFQIILVVVLLFGGYKVWNKYFNYNFGVITEGKVYKSGAIKPEKIEDYTSKYGIKTIIDLRNEVSDGYTSAMEKEAVDKIDGVEYIRILSPQLPTKANIEQFLKILDDKTKYPVLIHCYHGLGRTMLYTAIYRIEYEGFTNREAKELTRPWQPEDFLWYKSAFSDSKPKGKFLLEYIPRSKK